MNIFKAYYGAMCGLRPIQYNTHIRDAQYAITTELALMRPRGKVIDGQQVSAADLEQLKDRGEVRLK